MDSYSKSYWEKCGHWSDPAKPMRSGKVLEQSYGLYQFSRSRGVLRTRRCAWISHDRWGGQFMSSHIYKKILDRLSTNYAVSLSIKKKYYKNKWLNFIIYVPEHYFLRYNRHATQYTKLSPKHFSNYVFNVILRQSRYSWKWKSFPIIALPMFTSTLMLSCLFAHMFKAREKNAKKWQDFDRYQW